ncbi:MAG: hypothetical protein V1928_03795 [Parcubacteria group bacterium]
MKNRIFAFVGLLMFVCLVLIGCGYHHHCDRNQVYANGQCQVSCANDYTCIHDVEAGPSFKCDTNLGYCVEKETRPAVRDGGVPTVDGGFESAVQTRICCPTGTGQVELWYGSTAHATSSGASCENFWMPMAAFCQRGAHPNSLGGWYTFTCHNGGGYWGGWTSASVVSVTNQNGSPYSYSVIRGTVNTSGVAEVVVYGTCQQ